MREMVRKEDEIPCIHPTALTETLPLPSLPAQLLRTRARCYWDGLGPQWGKTKDLENKGEQSHDINKGI